MQLRQKLPGVTYYDYVLAHWDLQAALLAGDEASAWEAWTRPSKDMDWYDSLKNWAENVASFEEMQNILNWDWEALDEFLNIGMDLSELNHYFEMKNGGN